MQNMFGSMGAHSIKVDMATGTIAPYSKRPIGEYKHFSTDKSRLYVSKYGVESYDLAKPARFRYEAQIQGQGSQSSRQAGWPAKLSPNGNYIIARSQSQLTIAKIPAKFDAKLGARIKHGSNKVPFKTLSKYGVDELIWSDDGQSIIWSQGHKVYVQKLADIDWNGPKETYTDYTAEIKASQIKDKGTIVFRGATIMTIGSKGTIKNADLVVKDGEFIAVGKRGKVKIPAISRLIDQAIAKYANGYRRKLKN